MFTLDMACNRAHILSKIILCMVQYTFRMIYSLICRLAHVIYIMNSSY